MSLKNKNIFFLTHILFPARLINLCRSMFPSDFPGGWDGKESTCNVGDVGLIPGLERPPGEGNDYPLQYSGLEDSVDRGAWQATYSPRGHKESDTTKQLSLSHFHLVILLFFLNNFNIFFYCKSTGNSFSQLCLQKEILYFIYKRSFWEN